MSAAKLTATLVLVLDGRGLFQKDEVYLNLVLEYIPETVYRASRHYAKLKQTMPMIQIKVSRVSHSFPEQTDAERNTALIVSHAS